VKFAFFYKAAVKKGIYEMLQAFTFLIQTIEKQSIGLNFERGFFQSKINLLD
jgi:hypothetical protein